MEAGPEKQAVRTTGMRWSEGLVGCQRWTAGGGGVGVVGPETQGVDQQPFDPLQWGELTCEDGYVPVRAVGGTNRILYQ